MNIYYKPLYRTDPRMSLSEALMYCTFLHHKGKSGWRIPTQREVQLIIDHRNASNKSTVWYERQYLWTQEVVDTVTSVIDHKSQYYVLAVKNK